MEKVSIKTYAVKHKLSIFNVMKMVKSGKLKIIVEKVDNKEITYILLDEKIEEEVKKGIVVHTDISQMTLKDEVKKLQLEVKQLKIEIEEVKKLFLENSNAKD